MQIVHLALKASSAWVISNPSGQFSPQILHFLPLKERHVSLLTFKRIFGTGLFLKRVKTPAIGQIQAHHLLNNTNSNANITGNMIRFQPGS
jgi:hypothetical protein